MSDEPWWVHRWLGQPGQIVYPDEWPPTISHEDFQKLWAAAWPTPSTPHKPRGRIAALIEWIVGRGDT